MAQIEYCEKPLSDTSWNPSWDAESICEEAEQSAVDEWFDHAPTVWMAEPEILVIQAELVKTDKTHIEKKFEVLANQWRLETRSMSSTTDRVLHWAYQDIIGMGESVLKFIFREMQSNGGHWFWALRHITHDNPVSPQDAGKINKMTEAWLRWGRDHHYL